MKDIATTPLLRRFYWRWEKALEALIPGPDIRILAACSGGCDSMVLAWLLRESMQRGLCHLLLGHINHKIRPEAGGDEQLLRSIATNWDCTLITKEVDAPRAAAESGQSLEQAARIGRLTALEQIAREHHCQFIALGHHLNDQAETVLLRLLRGVGPKGLGAMAPISSLPIPSPQDSGIPVDRSAQVRPLLIRPLLDFPHTELREMALEAGLEWVEDKSNEDTEFLRNRIRHQLLPQLCSDYNPRIVESLCDLARWQRLDDEPLSRLAGELYQKVLLPNPPESEDRPTKPAPSIRLDGATLAQNPSGLITRVLWLAYQEISGTDTALSGSHMQSLLNLVDRCHRARSGRASNRQPVAASQETHLPNRIRARLKKKEMIFEYHDPRPVVSDR